MSLPPGAGEVLASVDVVFPVLHGPYGEDGTIQGLLELARVPYVGAGVLASAAGMDKEFTKKLLAADGIPGGPHVVLRPLRPTLHPEERELLGLPVFVKPARGGSSIGVSRVSSWDQLPAAVAYAREHDGSLGFRQVHHLSSASGLDWLALVTAARPRLGKPLGCSTESRRRQSVGDNHSNPAR